MTDAWRQAHHAAQIAAEVGKSWARPRDDDSHSSFGWREGVFEGVATNTEPSFRARLDIRAMTLALVTLDGIVRDQFGCHGHTLRDAVAWADAAATRLGGERRQPATPAPDLPDHPVARGTAFDISDSGAFDALVAWYGGADALLRTLATKLPQTGEPRCWPHHFDLAVLSIVASDDTGAMTATIGIGLTPPDALDDSGYWYVGPWLREAAGAPVSRPELPIGRWHEREGTMPLAVAPLHEIAALGDAKTQEQELAGFLSVAVNTCRAMMG
jgi:hypothetical protein